MPEMRKSKHGWCGVAAALGVWMLLGIAAVAAQPQSLLRPFRWRNIGPAAMMGRVSCIDAFAADYKTVLIGAASGGVFKSTNGGVTWKPIFDGYGSQSIGDVAFFQKDTSIVWVGTGEATNRNSVGWGDGIYKSTDGGKTFKNMGLRDTQQIAEIATHPADSLTVYVAALGHLWGYSGSRGLFKTTDGGRTWTKLTNGLPDDGKTGATVVALDPANPEIVFAGMYQRLRQPWAMHSGGPNGGLFKSTDGGRSWRKLTTGLPAGETGQIDISICRSNPKIIFAYIEASDELPDDSSAPGPGVYRSEDGGETWTYLLRHNSRPYYHGRIRVAPDDDQLVYVVSRDFQYSTDGGKTFTRGHPWRNGGGDDHDLWIDPRNHNHLYMATDQGAYLTVDGGTSLLAFNNMAIGQYYAIGVDMREPYWVYGGLQDNGGWGVPSNSRDRAGILNDHVTVTNGGDGFHMQVDPTDWRTLYTTAHVGYFGRQNMQTREHKFITPTPQTTVNFAGYYDPAFPEEPTNYSINPEERWLWSDIPNRTINGNILPPQFRWNWNSPLVLSPTNPFTLYVGSSYLFKSTDRGETWRIISPDLTKNDPATRNSTRSGGLTKDATGAENHNTIYTIAPSPMTDAVIWAGTDDGHIQVTRDGGVTWANVSRNVPGLPAEIWVSRVEASHFSPATAYVSLDGHRQDDTAPYLFKTTDYGQTWQDISGDLPREIPGNSVHTIVEDAVNPNLLFAGTEFGCFVTLDGGRQWRRFMANLPPVAVRDLVIHPRDRDLIAGTHGRSIWIADDISPLEQLTPQVLQAEAFLFENRVATKWQRISKGRIQNFFKFKGENPPAGALIHFYLKSTPKDSLVEITIEDPIRARRRVLKTSAVAGINRAVWNFEFLPTAQEKASHRAFLAKVIETLVREVKKYPKPAVLDGLKKDLLATQRYPNLYEKADYPDKKSARRLLLDHLQHIRGKLEQAGTVKEFFGVREQLLAFSQIVGNRAFFGFFGEELRPVKADAGTYRLTLTVRGRSVSGTLTVRDDPLLARPRP